MYRSQTAIMYQQNKQQVVSFISSYVKSSLTGYNRRSHFRLDGVLVILLLISMNNVSEWTSIYEIYAGYYCLSIT